MIKPLEKVLDTTKCVLYRKNKNLGEGLLIVTSARVLFKGASDVVTFLREGLSVNRAERKGEYWVLLLKATDQEAYFRFYGVQAAQESLKIHQ